MINVLHFYKTYYPDSFGGVEQVIYQLCEGSREHGINAQVLSLSSRGHQENQAVGHHLAHCEKMNFSLASTPFSWSVIKKFKELAKKADIIHYHFPYPFMDLLHFATAINKPTLVTYHSDIVKQKMALKLYQPLMTAFLKRVDCIVASSPNYVQTSPILQKFEQKVQVVPFGLNNASYPNITDAESKYWTEKFPTPFFLFIGAFRYYKGLHFLIEAAKGADYPIVIIGSGPSELELKQQALKNGITNVHFVGAVSDKDKVALLKLCYGIVFPSHLRSEAFGISLLEGAMYNKPLISCEIGTGTTYINIDKQTGLAISPANPDALRHAMDLLWSSPKLANEYGSNAGLRFNSVFTYSKMIENYSRIYHELL
jgi:glycosyltransferase involved in cell wall biosynthesis